MDIVRADFGTTLAIILVAPILVSLIKAVSDWIKLRNATNITIETGDRKIIAKNISSGDASTIIEMLLDKDQSKEDKDSDIFESETVRDEKESENAK